MDEHATMEHALGSGGALLSQSILHTFPDNHLEKFASDVCEIQPGNEVT